MEEDSRFRPRTDKQKLDWLKCAQWAINQMGEYGDEKVADIIDIIREDKFWVDKFNSLLKLQTKNKENVLFLDYFWEKVKNKVEYGT